MNKTILFALLALAIPASAASIDWKLNTGAAANYMQDSKGNKLTGTAYLVLSSDLPGEGEKFASETAIIEKAIGGSEGGIAITDGVNTTVKTSTDSRLRAPESYTFMVLVYDSVNKEYFTSSTEKSMTAYNTSGDEYTDAKQVSFNAQQLYATSTLRGTQTYHAVPEPSVALMGLLGLGMLLKRRRA
jgi:hypothetical protein